MIKWQPCFYTLLLCILSSCLGLEELDLSPAPPRSAPYYPFLTNQEEWLDHKGTWIYFDSLEGKSDTIWGTSGVSLRRPHHRTDFFGETYIDYYYDEAWLHLENTYLFNDDSLMVLTAKSKVNFNIGEPTGIVYGHGICLVLPVCRQTMFEMSNISIPTLGFTQILKSKRHSLWGYRTFYLAKDVGIIKVQYNLNDSINTLNLVEYIPK